MNLLTHVRTHHPNLWNKYTPHDVNKLVELTTKDVQYIPPYKAKQTIL